MLRVLRIMQTWAKQAIIYIIWGCITLVLSSLLVAKPGFGSDDICPKHYENLPVHELTLPSKNGLPNGITAGSDDNIWFIERAENKIARIMLAASSPQPLYTITEFSIPTQGSNPQAITSGADGNVWFTERIAIGRISPAGDIAEFPVSPGSAPDGITAGPDGNIWFTEHLKDKIGRITLDGKIIEYSSRMSGPLNMIADAHGNLWVTEEFGNKIAFFTPPSTRLKRT